MIVAILADTWARCPQTDEVVVPAAVGNVASWRALERAAFRRIAEGGLTPDNPATHESTTSTAPHDRARARPAPWLWRARNSIPAHSLAPPKRKDHQMRYRKLGSSQLEVSEISLGSWLTFAGGVGLEQTRACTDAALEEGINFFDTANAYGRGAAESAWGEILSGRPRDSYILATKVWGQMSDDPADRGLSGVQIAKQIDASLERLRVEYVDLYQCHRFDPDVPIEETLEALQEVVASGKTRYLGFSEWTPEQIQAAIDIAGADLFVSSQPQYSMLWRAPEVETFPLCEANGISQI